MGIIASHLRVNYGSFICLLLVSDESVSCPPNFFPFLLWKGKLKFEVLKLSCNTARVVYN